MDNMIYIAEDNTDIRELLACSIEAFGFRVKEFKDGDLLLQGVKNEKPHMVILDIMMPTLDGISTMKMLKTKDDTKDIPIIILSARGGEVDKVKCLDLGADDYIVKPFSILELKSRINAVFRRCDKKVLDTECIIKVGTITLDAKKYKVFIAEGEIILSKKEFALLKCLMLAKGSVVKRDDILKEVWGYDFMGETRTLDMHIKTLRQKVKDQNNNQIMTVRGIGYMIGE